MLSKVSLTSRVPLVSLLGLVLAILPADMSVSEEISYPGNGTLRTDPLGSVMYDGYLYPDETTGNSVTVYGYVEISAYGGVSSGSDNVTDNRIYIMDTAKVEEDIFGGISVYGKAQHNTVIFYGTGGRIYGGWSYFSEASHNSVILAGGSAGVIYGGFSLESNFNRVTVIDGGFFGQIFGGTSISSDSTENTVSVSGGTVGDIYGGESWSHDASSNRVNISGGKVTFQVFGGTAGVDAVHNIVSISGSPDIGGAQLFGGRSLGSGDAFTGNTLEVLNYAGVSPAGDIGNFQSYRFILPASMDGPLKVSGAVDVLDPRGTLPNSSVVSLDIMAGGRAPKAGDRLELITAGGFSGSFANRGSLFAGSKGATLDVLFRIDQTAGELYADVEWAGASDRAKALSEAYLAGLMIISQGGDLAAGQGMAEAANAAARASVREANGISTGLGSFAVFSGGRSRYESGSSVDASGMSLMTGLAWGRDLSYGRLTLGAFVEYGYGSYGTFNSFPGSDPITGDGTIRYLGGGILGRMEFDGSSTGSFHAEASVRAGTVRSHYRTSGLPSPGVTGPGHNGYDSTSGYFGMHLGGGYLWNISENATLDVYAKYLWTRREGDSVVLSSGDPVVFDAANSHRVRAGARLAWTGNQLFTPFIGFAYEHELDGKARAWTYGYEIQTPSARGGTGIGEIGVSLKPSEGRPVSLELAFQGYAGKRDGWTGSFLFTVEF